MHQGQDIKESQKTVGGMAGVSKYFQTVQFMKVIGSKIYQMGKGFLRKQMEVGMKEIFRIKFLMEKGNLLQLIKKQFMKGSLKMMSKMVLGLKLSMANINTQATLKIQRKMELGR